MAAPIVTNESPVPDAAGVVRDTNILFDVTDPDDGVNQSTIQVSVQIGSADFVPAVVDGAVVFPYDDTGAQVSVITDGFRVTMNYRGKWSVGTIVTVRADAENGISLPMTQVEYTFTTGSTPATVALELTQIAQG